MIDYHLHLWSHGSKDKPVVLEELAAYCEHAAAQGVSEIAVTEHFYRFSQARSILSGYFRRYPESPMRDLMEQYWEQNATADLDQYVAVALEAKAAGLPVVMGLEVDYYPEAMHRVQAMLLGYPFDVLLGSVHWIETWPFDHIDDPVVMAEWERVGVEPAWAAYTRALEELAATHTVDVLAHPDLVKVAGHRPKVPQEYFDRMAEAAATAGVAAEVSSAGMRKPVREFYPAPGLLRRFLELEVPLTTASDAHGLGDVADRAPEIKELLVAHGVTTLRRFEGRVGTEVAL
ncbi:MAG: PHP domain-containing protein [Ferrimicrobium sp.]|uniref:PHP domain-containing protein n=1 Tax=Ferrimicrobium sp. TaxID=2926050 RepID=UPI0026279399|nr:PHP domain-containing protein [Ferrimicrobium sp.]